MNVVKIGGSSLRSITDFERLAQQLIEHLAPPAVVVISALPRVTRLLEEAAYIAESGDIENASAQLTRLVARHRDIAHTLLTDRQTIEALEILFDDIEQNVQRLLLGVAITRELTPRTLDRITGVGERMALHLTHHILSERGLEAVALPAAEIIVTDARFGNARPDVERTAERIRRRLLPLLEQHGIVLTEGFVGATLDDQPTTMGKESSTLTAALLSALLHARMLVLYTPVAGIYTADPHHVPTARRIEQLSYGQAERLARVGLKLLYPTMITPLQDAGIVLRITALNAENFAGTLISEEPSHDGVFVVMEEALSAVELKHDDYYHALRSGWRHRGIAVEHGMQWVVAAEPHEIVQLPSLGLTSIPAPRDCVQIRVWASVRSPSTKRQIGQILAAVAPAGLLTLAIDENELVATVLTWSPVELQLPTLHEQILQACGLP